MKEINVYYGYINKFTIDANKHPDEQIKDLLELIKNSRNIIIDIYCNSPYIINNITLIEAYSNKQIPEEHRNMYKGINIINKHFEIKQNGDIIEGSYYKSMISDNNLLNNKLGESNNKFSDLLDLENQLNNKL